MGRRQLSKPPLAPEDLLHQMISTIGYQAAHQLVQREADALRCDPTSSYAIRSAWTVYQSDRTPVTQTHLPLEEE